MHELYIAQNIKTSMEQYILENGLNSIKVIHLKLGEMSMVVPELVVENFDIIKKGSKLKDTVLKFEKVPIRIKCNDCKKEGYLKLSTICCPYCSSMNIEIISGDQFFIDCIEY